MPLLGARMLMHLLSVDSAGELTLRGVPGSERERWRDRESMHALQLIYNAGKTVWLTSAKRRTCCACLLYQSGIGRVWTRRDQRSGMAYL